MTDVETSRRWSLWACLAAVGLMAACSTAPPVYKTVLAGDKEVPPVNTAATGLSDIAVRTGRCPSAGASSDCNMLVGTVQTTGINATAAHVHRGTPTENGPVIVTLMKTGADVWSVPLGTSLTASQYEDYLAGRLYVNVHSAAHPNGEIRAQIKPHH
jgi:hypothetical protein